MTATWKRNTSKMGPYIKHLYEDTGIKRCD